MSEQEITNKRVERQAQSAISEMAMELAYLTATIDRHKRENASLIAKVTALESANRLLAQERVMGSERLELAERELAKAREDADANAKRLLPYGWEVLAMARPLGTEMGLYDWTLRITKPSGQQVLVAVGESPSLPVKQAEQEVEVKPEPEPGPRDDQDALQWHLQRLKREAADAMRTMTVPVVEQSVLEKIGLRRAASTTFGPWGFVCVGGGGGGGIAPKPTPPEAPEAKP